MSEPRQWHILVDGGNGYGQYEGYAYADARAIVGDTTDIHVIEKSAYDKLQSELAEMKRERDLAIAHDRQPYPTAYAYEKTCEALELSKSQNAKLIEALYQLRPQKGQIADFIDKTIQEAIGDKK